MKTKKPLALLLAFALVIGIGVPAFAEDEPRILTQPQSKNLPYGADIVLSVEVYLPAGWKAEYQWEHRNGDEAFPDSEYFEYISGATESTLRLSPGDSAYDMISPYQEGVDRIYCCGVTFRGPTTNIFLRTDEASVTLGNKPADDLPRIITPPKDLTIRYGREFILSVDVYIPEGWTVAYEWYHLKPRPSLISKEPSARLSRRFPSYPDSGETKNYYCTVTATDKDGDVFNFSPQRAVVTCKTGAAEGWALDRFQNFLDWLENAVPSSINLFWFLVLAFPLEVIGELLFWSHNLSLNFSGWIRSWYPPVS